MSRKRRDRRRARDRAQQVAKALAGVTGKKLYMSGREIQLLAAESFTMWRSSSKLDTHTVRGLLRDVRAP